MIHGTMHMANLPQLSISRAACEPQTVTALVSGINIASPAGLRRSPDAAESGRCVRASLHNHIRILFRSLDSVVIALANLRLEISQIIGLSALPVDSRGLLPASWPLAVLP